MGRKYWLRCANDDCPRNHLAWKTQRPTPGDYRAEYKLGAEDIVNDNHVRVTEGDGEYVLNYAVDGDDLPDGELWTCCEACRDVVRTNEANEPSRP